MKLGNKIFSDENHLLVFIELFLHKSMWLIPFIICCYVCVTCVTAVTAVTYSAMQRACNLEFSGYEFLRRCYAVFAR